MTEALASKTCTPCRGGIPPLTREQAELFHAQAPDWQLLEEAHRIERSFRFRNFREALTFVQEIGELAEAEGPGCVKTLRGITAPRILRLVVALRAKKRKNSSFARHYDQIRFRFHTA